MARVPDRDRGGLGAVGGARGLDVAEAGVVNEAGCPMAPESALMRLLERLGRQGLGQGFLSFCLLMLLVMGCSRTPVVLPVQSIETYEFRQSQGGVRVAVDPFFTVDRIQRTFSGGEEFAEKGLLPVQIIVENGTQGEIQVNPQDFRLVRPNGRAEAALSAYDAFAMVKLSMGWWGLGAGVVGGSVPAYRNEARLRDIEDRELRGTPIPPGKVATGFVYFTIPENELNLAGSHVVFLVKGTAGRELFYEVAIAGRRDLPVPSRPSETVGPPGPSGPVPKDPSRTEGAGGRGIIIRSPSQ